MNLFDCHNHIQDERLFPDLGNVLERARTAGITQMAVKGCCESDWPRVIQILESHSGIFPSFGLHPWFIANRTANCFQTLESLLESYPQAGVGEIGIDHVIDNRDDVDQESVFLTQLEIARRFERPVTIHCRRAWGRLIELLDQFDDLPSGMLIHCFGGSAEVALELVKRGAYISFSGSITRPNAKKAGPAIRAVPADRLLIETDAPDILPHGLAAELNEPAFLRNVLTKAAELRGISEDALSELTVRNAEQFFRSTGVPPVSAGAAGSAAHGQHAHATVPGLSDHYANGTRLEEFHIRQGAHLPHWTREGGVYAITFRLTDSLPEPVLVSWKNERDNLLRHAEKEGRPLSGLEENRLRQLYSEKVESYLDAGHGECWLAQKNIAQLMKSTLFHFDDDRYVLLAWCIMPNHVHVVLHPLNGYELSGILHSWKSYSAKKANSLLEREGAFWQTEYYDHLIRDQADFRHAIKYVLENPARAGLHDWEWVGVKTSS